MIPDRIKFNSASEAAEEMKTIANACFINKSDVELIKNKLSQSKRTEADWDEIKAILSHYDLVTAVPTNPTKHVRPIGHMLCYDGYLHVFTNLYDCQRFLDKICDLEKKKYLFTIGKIPFSSATRAAEKCMKELYIDIAIDGGSCIRYDPFRKILIATMLVEACME